jgi:hypothetical protein
MTSYWHQRIPFIDRTVEFHWYENPVLKEIVEASVS